MLVYNNKIILYDLSTNQYLAEQQALNITMGLATSPARLY